MRIQVGRAAGTLPLVFLLVAASAAAVVGVQLSSSAHAARPGRAGGRILHRMAPACPPPSVTDIDGLGDDATWTAGVDDLTTIGQSLTVDDAGTVLTRVEVIVGDPSAVSDPADLAIGSEDVIARAVASIEDSVNNLVSLITDLVVDPPDLGNLPVFVLIDYTPPADCAGADDGVGRVADPVGTLIVQ